MCLTAHAGQTKHSKEEKESFHDRFLILFFGNAALPGNSEFILKRKWFGNFPNHFRVGIDIIILKKVTT